MSIVKSITSFLPSYDYLDLQPPVMCSFDFQSTSSSAPPTPLIYTKEDTSVFGDDDGDNITVDLDIPEECVDLLLERRCSSGHSELHTKL